VVLAVQAQAVLALAVSILFFLQLLQQAAAVVVLTAHFH
jgi:hypothetical protein